MLPLKKILEYVIDEFQANHEVSEGSVVDAMRKRHPIEGGDVDFAVLALKECVKTVFDGIEVELNRRRGNPSLTTTKETKP